jgi:hypothetical protein
VRLRTAQFDRDFRYCENLVGRHGITIPVL